MPSPKVPNLDAIRPQSVPKSPKALRQGFLEDDWFARDKKQKAHVREQRAKNVLHWAILANVILAGFCLAGALLSRAYHLIAPEGLVWLNIQQLETLDNLAKFTATGALGGLLTKYLNKNSED